MSRHVRILAALAVALGLGACAAPKKVAPPASAPVAAAAPAQPPAAQGPDRTKPPENGAPPELRVPAQVKFALSNGLAVRLVEYRRLPIVAMNLVVDAGAARDPGPKPGLASFTASMLTEGTKTRSATQISDEAGFLGASISAGAAVDSATLSGATLARHLPKFLALFADVAMNPAFPKADFERVQDERLVTLLQQRDQPQAIASKAFQPVFWGAHPYGHYSLGTEEAVKAARPGDLADFHGRFWRPGNAELVVVGDVSEAELRPLLDATLGRWKAGERAPRIPDRAPAAPHATVLVDKPDAPQAFVLLGMPGLERSSPDFVAATVAFQVLGGGNASRLFRNLREEKGYTYGMGAGADARRLAGASVVRGSVKADVTGAALREVARELQRMRDEPVPAEELEDAKAALVLSLPGDFASVSGIAGRVAELVVHGLPDDYWTQYADAVKATTADDVRRVAQRYLDSSRATLVLVGAPAVVTPQLAAEGLPFGKVEVRPPPGGAAPARKPKPTPAKAPAPRAPASVR
jgi:zinc protease